MFIKKAHVDVKKLTSKIQDSKKDTASRLRHLRTILGKRVLLKPKEYSSFYEPI